MADAETIRSLLAALADVQEGQCVRRRGDIYGIRNLMDVVPEVWELAASQAVRTLVAPVVGPDAFPVRGTLFDKTPEANWNVVWHQDLSIAVREKRAVPGFGPWSEKAGVPHVQPPAAVLERMLTLRLHLDACGADNGPLRVFAGSHQHGRFSTAEISGVAAASPGNHLRRAGGRRAADAPAPAPRIVGRPGAGPPTRRVIHLDFAAGELPGGLCWHARP